MTTELDAVPFDDPPVHQSNGSNGSHDFQVGFVWNAQSPDEVPAELAFRAVIADVTEGKWAKQIQHLREKIAEVGKEAAKPLKLRLPAALFSGTFAKRKADALKRHSGLICVDLDDLGDRLPSIREAIECDPHTLCAFVSPSGTGLKVIFRCNPEKPHIHAFRSAERYVLETFGLEIDPACKDVNRLCFVSFDPETFIADHCEVLPEIVEPAEFKPPTEAKTETRAPARPLAGVEPWDDYDLRGDLPALLRAHGWTECGKHGWTRPGKTSGLSATWGKVPGRFYVFTSSTEFEANHTYRPWHVYAILNHGGNWKQAVAALRKEGFGTAPTDNERRQAAHNKRVAEESPLGNGNQPDNSPKVYDPGYEEQQNTGQTQSPTEDPSSKIKPFTLWAPSQFIAFVPDPSACLLGTGYLELGQWTSLIGIGGLGKTRLALWLVVCQVLRRAWCGIPTNGTPQKSVILSTENGLRRWKEDLTKILGTLTDAERAIVEANVRILAMTDDEDGDLCLGSSDNVVRLKLTLTAATPGIVVFDPFADMMDGDENKTSDLVATITKLRAITRACCAKAAILIIHHGRTGSANVAQAGDNFNAGNFGRGAKALYSKVRCELQLAPEDRDNPNRLVLACGKANDTVKFAPRCLVFNEDDFSYRVDPSFDIDAWRDDVSGKRKKSTLTIADIVQVVQEKCRVQGTETDTKTVIAAFEGSGAADRTIQNYIKQGIEAGYLRKGSKRWNLRLGAKPLPKS